jgi:ATP-dependent Lon protease
VPKPTKSVKSVALPPVPNVYPLVPLRDTVVFPHLVCPLLIGRPRSLAALEEAVTAYEEKLVLVAQMNSEVEDPKAQDLYRVGTLVQVHQMMRLPDGSVKVLVEGIERVKIDKIRRRSPSYQVAVTPLLEEETPEVDEWMTLKKVVLEDFSRYVQGHPKLPESAFESVKSIEDPEHLTDLLASFLQIDVAQKQELLSTTSVYGRLTRVGQFLHRQLELLNLEFNIHEKVRGQIEQAQKEYYLREQMKIIQEELGEGLDENADLRIRIDQVGLSEASRTKVERELKRLEKLPSISPESGVLRNYLEWIASLPWQKRGEGTFDLDEAERILENDHHGLKKVKERITEFLAVRQLLQQNTLQSTETLQKQEPALPPARVSPTILCLVGPPGVGKTSLAQSIARGLNRKFVRVSLGGVRDEAEIRGHRRTYIGALPGRIIQALKDVGEKNPVMLLDEVDKLSYSMQGDPAAALLEVLDPEQNSNFSDHFVELPFDLSEVFFICTANTIDTIPGPLLDRMEVVTLSSYTELEKEAIARRHLIPKQISRHGLTEDRFTIQKPALMRVVREYTREAGVRTLERTIGALCRKAARQILKAPKQKVVVTEQNLEKYLGQPMFIQDEIMSKDQVGVCTGLAWTPFGGCTLQIEVNVMPGKGKLQLTGQLGDVMKESAQAAFSYIHAHRDALGVPTQFPSEMDVHVHIPEGATPKDGPSAGLAMATALISALTGHPVRRDVAMTGEITLRGRALMIGGLKEKTLAAARTGIKKVLFPIGNIRDLEELPKEVKAKLELVPVEFLADVLPHALEMTIQPAVVGFPMAWLMKTNQDVSIQPS